MKRKLHSYLKLVQVATLGILCMAVVFGSLVIVACESPVNTKNPKPQQIPGTTGKDIPEKPLGDIPEGPLGGIPEEPGDILSEEPSGNIPAEPLGNNDLIEIEYPVSLSTEYVTGFIIDPLTAWGPYDVKRSESPFDRKMTVQVIKAKKTNKITVNWLTDENVNSIIKSGSQQNGVGVSIPIEMVSFGTVYKKAVENSRMSSSSSYLGRFSVRIATERQDFTIRSASALKPYLSNTFIRDIQTLSAERILAIYGPFVLLSIEYGLYIDATLVTEKSAVSSLSSYSKAIELGASFLENTLKGTISSGNEDMKETHNVSARTSFESRIIGGDYRKEWLTLDDALDGLPYAVQTLNEYNADNIGLSTFDDTIPIWDLVAEINPEKANEVFRAFIRQAGAKAMEYESMFGGWMESHEYKTAGQNILNLQLSQNDIIMLTLFGGNSGPQGDYWFQYAGGFLGLETIQGWSSGASGQFGSAAAVSFPVSNSTSMDADRIDLKFSVSVGNFGRTGDNAKGANPNGVGSKGEGGESTLVIVERKQDNAMLKIIANGGNGGGYPPITTPAVFEPGAFEFLEFKSSLGTTTSPASIDGLTGPSGNRPGYARISVLKLN